MTGIPEVQAAVRAVEGVASASVRWPDPLGPATLHVEFTHDLPAEQRAETTEQIMGILRDVGGVDLSTLEVGSPVKEVQHTRVGRPVFSGMTIDRRDLDTTVDVALRFGERDLSGRAEGIATPAEGPRTAATATLTALRDLMPDGVRLQLDWLQMLDEDVPGRPTVIQAAVICLTRDTEEVFVGSALVRGDPKESAVRATLDALNRRLIRLLERPREVEPA